jgi:hypothetical protein
MADLFVFSGVQWRGIFVLLVCLLVLAFVVQWLIWMFGLGRFKATRVRGRRDTLSFVFADLMVKIINDFRHLLALIVVAIFAIALITVLALASNEADSLAALSTGLQAVVSAFGGLIGAIIGYYFGERAGEQAGSAEPPRVAAEPPVQAFPESSPVSPDIEQAPAPPVLPDIENPLDQENG